MINISFAPAPYSPPQFTSPPDDCPICPARLAMDEAFEAHGGVLEQLSAVVDALDCRERPSFNQLLRQYTRAFNNVVTAYRMSHVCNQAIYYGIEKYGRLRESAEAVLAYDGYRAHALKQSADMDGSFEALRQAVASLAVAAEALGGLIESHRQVRERIDAFWPVCDEYTEERKDQALRLL